MSTNRWIVVVALAGVALGAGVAQAKKEPNRQVMERWFEAVDSKQADKLASVEAADIEMKTPMGLTKGSEGHVQMTQMFAAAFPNFKHTPERARGGQLPRATRQRGFAGRSPATPRHRVRAHRTTAPGRDRPEWQSQDPFEVLTHFVI